MEPRLNTEKTAK